MPDVLARNLHRRRAADHGRPGRLRAWWSHWGALVTGVWMIAVSVVLLWVALQFHSQQSKTTRAARDSCHRSRTFGPALARAYGRYHILTPAELAAFRAGIPKPGDCP